MNYAHMCVCVCEREREFVYSHICPPVRVSVRPSVYTMVLDCGWAKSSICDTVVKLLSPFRRYVDKTV